MKYITCGVADEDGRPVATRKLLEQMLAHNPAGLVFHTVRGVLTTYKAPELPTDLVLVVSGPDVVNRRLWTAHVLRRPEGVIIQ